MAPFYSYLEQGVEVGGKGFSFRKHHTRDKGDGRKDGRENGRGKTLHIG